jgi:endogenous inhibitor of DNA gyrase (YacG/DUF329 family)
VLVESREKVQSFSFMATVNATCPICRRELASGPRLPTHPFCSERCKLVDLGNWLGNGYVIAGPAAEGLEDIEGLDPELLAALLRESS